MKYWRYERMVGSEFLNYPCSMGVSGQQEVGEAYGERKERKGLVGGGSV